MRKKGRLAVATAEKRTVDKLTKIAVGYLGRLSPAEQEKRLKALEAVADETAAQLDADGNTPSTSSPNPCIPPSRVAARGR